MPSFAPRRFDSFDDDDWAAVFDTFERLVVVVGHDCLRGVMRARVQQVDTRTPHPHYL